MKNVTLFFAVAITFLIASCNNDTKTEQQAAIKEPPRAPFVEQIKSLEDAMHKSPEINDSLALLAIKAYSDYALFFPNDTLSPNYLFKAGEIATAAKKYKQALIYYQTITAKYPDFKYIRESLYLQGFLLDNFMNDDASAKIIYDEIIEKYPNTNYAKDAKSALNNLGKSDEQIIEEFKKKNGKK
jgi:tetratricopeptide (TPR) repeat protein